MSDPPQFSMSSLASALPVGVGSSMSSGGGVGVGGGLGGVGGGGGGGPASSANATAAAAAHTLTAAEAMLNAQLASALSTMGDAQYFEESISPGQIRTSLANADPSNPSSTPALLRGMKWLLASMSKGRDVSDFFPHVVKLVGSHSLEARKMVYIYLSRYADFDPTCRELALLAINSFQRGLADGEALIRALALRTMTSIRVRDVLQIQIMAVQRCAADTSPYVRKCAANALTKLFPRCGEAGKESCLDILTKLLEEDASTMVLTSVLVAFTELCPERLDLLHKPYRKICHLLTDMDEWGQIVILDVLSRYCRMYFKEPRTRSRGSAELIDRDRRVRRTVKGIESNNSSGGDNASANGGDDDNNDGNVGNALDELFPGSSGGTKTKKKAKDTAGATSALPPHPGSSGPQKIKRRVVKKAFYSDEEDESTEEEVYIGGSVSATLKEGSLLGQPQSGEGRFGPGIGGAGGLSQGAGVSAGDDDDYEDSELDEDHRLLLRSSLPLLKSRNSGVVLAVCSLHYYCGVASIRVRAAMGKSLVRIYRDKREIQYVVLTSIRTLVQECPSAFTPFLGDFFVKAMDPQFTRMIKLDILTALSLDPGSIEAVLKELRTYIRHNDKDFVRASIQTVGKVAEMARIVYDRRGVKTGSEASARADADLIALNCLFGLLTLSQASEDTAVVGECIVVMENVMRQLLSESSKYAVADPNAVQSESLKRLMKLLLRAIDAPRSAFGGYDEEEDSKQEDDEQRKNFKERTVLLPPTAVASALSIVGDWFCASPSSQLAVSLLQISDKEKHRMRSEVLRLICRTVARMDPCEKLQCIHFASKALLVTRESSRTSSRSDDDMAMCEYILAMGRVDVLPDVRDRARFESHLLNATIGLTIDTEALSPCPPEAKGKLSAADARAILLANKPAPSYLPVEEDNNDPSLRFGSLSSLISRKAGQAYIPLPQWATENSSSDLRAPPEPETPADEDGWKVRSGDEVAKSADSFYDSDDESSSSSSDDSSSSGESSSGSDSDSNYSSSSGSGSSSDDDSSSDESSSDESSEDDTMAMSQIKANGTAIVNGFAPSADLLTPSLPTPTQNLAFGDTGNSSSSSSEENSFSDDSDRDESSHEDDVGVASSATDNLLGMGGLSMAPAPSPAPVAPAPKMKKPESTASSELAMGLEGLVMAPIVVDKDETSNGDKANAEKDSSAWQVVVRPELSGGLRAKARFLRGATKDRESKMMGFDTASSMVLCVQMNFENKRADSGVLRRIRLIQRSAGGGGTFSPRRLSLPLEISVLKSGQSSTVLLGLEFAEKSDKDKVFLSKLEVKSDRGTNTVEIRPPLAETVLPYRMKKTEYEAAASRLQSITQRTVSSFSLKATGGSSTQQLHAKLPQIVVKSANLYPVDNKNLTWKSDNTCDFAGRLPASATPIFVTIKADPKSGAGTVVVLCDNLMAANSLADYLKKSVQG